MKNVKVKQNRLLAAMTYIIIFGDLVKVPVKVGGVTLTLFRLTVLALFLLCIWRGLETGKITVHKHEGFLYLMVIVWIGWAILSLLLSPYSNHRMGMKEILSIINGFFILFIYFQLEDEYSKSVVLCAIRNSVLILSVVGVLEILTGIHLNTSRLAALEESVLRYGFLIRTNSRLATGIFYNENDFCCFLAIFGPTVFYSRRNSSSGKLVLKLLVTLVLIGIFLIDDANIAIGSLLCGLLFLFLRKRKITPTIFVVGLLSIPVVFYSFNVVGNRIRTVFHSQFQRFHGNAGSLYLRTDIYKKSLSALRQTNWLGIGAGGFPDYIIQTYPSSILINPHNVWLEILATYGVVVFSLFVGAFIVLLLDLIKKVRYEKDMDTKIVVACFLAFVLGGLIPSSFLGYNYLWLLFALGCLTAKMRV